MTSGNQEGSGTDSRREFLKRAGAAAWAVPTLQVVNMASAAAQTTGSVVTMPPSTTGEPPCQPFKVDDGLAQTCQANGNCEIVGGKVVFTNQDPELTLLYSVSVGGSADCGDNWTITSSVVPEDTGHDCLYPYKVVGVIQDQQGVEIPFAINGMGTNGGLCTNQPHDQSIGIRVDYVEIDICHPDCPED